MTPDHTQQLPPAASREIEFETPGIEQSFYVKLNKNYDIDGYIEKIIEGQCPHDTEYIWQLDSRQNMLCE